jgi:alkanesulfonate monooxygenase SsuD/methylene tetrahydromethanopterin reductase-like flavin-dependent oxidoreductase (luciferase family)
MEFGLAPIQSNPTFEPMLEQAALAEELGFATLWAHEHHSQAMMYPDPLMALAAMAGVTRRIGLGTNMLLLPIHHPVRVAQEAAMVDVLSHGRLQLGVAGGYSPTDLRTFGVPSLRRGARTAAGVELIRQLWSGDAVTREGDGFHLEGFRLFPLPVQRPGPPILIGAQAEPAIKRAARLGDNYVISTTETFAHVAERVAMHRTARRELGLSETAPLLNRIVCVVESRAARTTAVEFFARALLSLYDAWGHANVTVLSDSERAPERVAHDHFVIGEASECIERIEAYAELGIGHIACLMNFGGPGVDLVERSMRSFAERVLPRFA